MKNEDIVLCYKTGNFASYLMAYKDKTKTFLDMKKESETPEEFIERLRKTLPEKAEIYFNDLEF